MMVLCIPWLLIFFVLLLIILLVMRKYKSSIGILIIIGSLNYYYEVFPVQIFASGLNTECELKVLSFNIDGTSESVIAQVDHLADLIIKADADVVYLAEDSYSICDELDSLIKKKYPYTTHTVCNDAHYFYSKYPLTIQERLVQNVDALAWVVSSSVNVNGKHIALYGCHLSSNNYSATANGVTARDIDGAGTFYKYIQNIRAASILRKQEAKIIVDSLSRLSVPSIVLGDMNDVSGSPALRTFNNAGLSNAWSKGGNGYGATIHFPLPYRIDHIFYKDSQLKLQFVEKISAEGLSDHDALLAGFRFVD